MTDNAARPEGVVLAGRRLWMRWLVVSVAALMCSGSVVGLCADASEPLISIDARNEPLGRVLDQITRDTAFTFIVDEQWRDYPVRTTFEELSLNDGLKRILANLNHVIIYESPREIRIAIYGRATPVSGSSPAARPYEPPAAPDEQSDDMPPAEESPGQEAPPADDGPPAEESPPGSAPSEKGE